MTTDLFYIYRTFLESQNIRFLFLNESFDGLEQMDLGFRQSVYENYNYSAMADCLKKEISADSILIFTDDLGLHYCVFELPTHCKKEYLCSYVMIGPVLFESAEPANEIDNSQNNDLFSTTFLGVRSRIPTLKSMDAWLSLLRPFIKEIFGENISFRFQTYKSEPEINLYDEPVPTKDSLHQIEDRYYVEKQMMDAVKKGDNKSALFWYSKFEDSGFLPRASDEMRHKKNMLLVLNTLLRRSIQAAGIHPFYVDQISYKQAVAIELTCTLKELDNLPKAMIRKYCMVVHNHNFEDYSAPIERCLQYIDFYYTRALSLDELAHHCCVTPNYLSALFRKEIGITLKEYINNIRIQRSIFLLNTTQLSIHDIAGRCGFPDANYYSRIFKRVNGTTPLNYRKTISQ